MTRENKLFVIRSNVATHGEFFAWTQETKRLMRTIGRMGMSYEHRRAIKRQAYFNVLHAIK